jgi:DNA invertase Pin-like site-specific DNA recombinase
MVDTKGQQVAYLRVSSGTQNLARQEDIAETADRVFREKQSGKDRSRPQLEEALKYLREGDTLNVWSMDRLARSLQDLQNIIEELTAKGASVHFVKEHLTFAPGTNDPYATFQLQILGAVAQLEREIIRERQREGIEKAKAEGKYKGRAKKLTAEQVATASERVANGVPKARIARELSVSRPTLLKELKEFEASQRGDQP